MFSILVGENWDFTPVASERHLFLDLHAVYADVFDVHAEVFNDATNLPTERTSVEHVEGWGLTHGWAYERPFFKPRYPQTEQVSSQISKNQGRQAIASTRHLNNLGDETPALRGLLGWLHLGGQIPLHHAIPPACVVSSGVPPLVVQNSFHRDREVQRSKCGRP